VLRTVLTEVELQAVDSRSEGMRKSAISFSPDRSGLVIAEPRQPEAAKTAVLA